MSTSRKSGSSIFSKAQSGGVMWLVGSIVAALLTLTMLGVALLVR